MKMQILPERLIRTKTSSTIRPLMWVVVVLILRVIPALSLDAADVDRSGVPTPEELAELVSAQAPSHVTIDSVEIVEAEEKGNVLMKTFQFTLKIRAELKEKLFRSLGAENGKIILQVSANEGDAIELDGKAVAAVPLSSIGNLERTVQVIIFPASPESRGSPLSLYSEGNYRIAGADSIETEIPALPIGPSGDQVSSTDPVALPNDAVSKILKVLEVNGEVWGADNSQSGFGTPIVLKELQSTGIDEYSGNLTFPYQRTLHPFTIRKSGKVYSFQILKSLDPTAGTRAAIYPLSVDSDMLKGIRTPEFPLSPGTNAELRESYMRSLVPWRSEGNISDYIQVNGSLINIETLETVAEDWIHAAVRPIEDFPTRYYAASSWGLSDRPFGAFASDRTSTQEPRFRKSIAPFPHDSVRSWVSPDLQRFFKIKDGDVWKGKIDWKVGETTDLENVTNLELLTNCEPITWYKDTLYLRNKSATENPIIRINLESGELEELPDSPPFAYYSFGSPDGRFLFTSDGRDGLLHVFDAEERATFTIDATRQQRQYGGLRKERPMPFAVQPTTWINEHIFRTQQGWFDLRSKSRLLFNEFEGILEALPAVPRVNRVFTIPGHIYLDVIVNGYSEMENGQIKVNSEKTLRFRINRVTGESVPLPLEFESFGVGSEMVWVDENRYLFARMQGGLSEVGTWLYDVRTGEHKRLTPFFPNGSARAENVSFEPGQVLDYMPEWFTSSSLLVLREKEKCVFRSQKDSKDELIIVDLSGGKMNRIPFPENSNRGSRGLRQIVDYPLQLMPHSF